VFRGEPAEEDQSISAFLRRIRSEDGSPLSELRFWSESSIMFFAGKCSSLTITAAGFLPAGMNCLVVHCSRQILYVLQGPVARAQTA